MLINIYDFLPKSYTNICTVIQCYVFDHHTYYENIKILLFLKVCYINFENTQVRHI